MLVQADHLPSGGLFGLFGLFGVIAQILAGDEASEGVKLLDEVRLIVVAVFDGEATPVDGLPFACALYDPGEALDAREFLGGKTDFLTKYAHELPVAERGLLCEPRDGGSTRDFRECAQGQRDGGVMFQWVGQLAEQFLFEDRKTLLRRPCAHETFAHLVQRPDAPERFERQMNVA